MAETQKDNYSFHHRVEHMTAGKHEVWHVIDAARENGDIVATCHSAEDALLVTRALNLATAETRLSVHD